MQQATSALRLHMEGQRQSRLSGVSSSKDTGPVGSGPTLTTLLTLITSLETPTQNTVTLGVQTSTHEFWGDTIQPPHAHGLKEIWKERAQCHFLCSTSIGCVRSRPFRGHHCHTQGEKLSASASQALHPLKCSCALVVALRSIQ